MYRKLSAQELVQAKSALDLEQDFILYNSLQLREARSFCLGDYREGERQAFACYLSGLPFHAFSIHLEPSRQDLERKYQASELLQSICTGLRLQESSESVGYLTLPEEMAAQIELDGVQSVRTMLLMKLTDPSKLLPAQGSRLLEEHDWAAVDAFVNRVNMISFRKEELTEFPHLGLFWQDRLVSIAGFHIFEDAYAEIGNIGTLPDHQGKGFGKRITSDICRYGLEKTSELYLFIFSENSPALRIYQSLGFQTVGRYSFIQFSF